MKTESKEILKFYSVTEAAAMWGLTVHAVRQLVKRGDVRPKIGIGKGHKFTGYELKLSDIETL